MNINIMKVHIGCGINPIGDNINSGIILMVHHIASEYGVNPMMILLIYPLYIPKIR